ncbi:spore germination protein KC [Melghirimyces profundicolus]|uniref:Spore germination protein KC n=1 Tax=Melghirimyces profundicolus TaxID=1242148 RepID=A0A2T6BYR6_9BACL|nr:Ger(x)C family spore germination protein [Melghirimyces profundicolus]PTX61224.1 spore germination protein KC [Melghirimyces profundicolus]
MSLPLKRLLNLCVITGCLVLMGGCWDAREIEERTSVAAMALDKTGEGYEVTVQIPNPLKIVGSGGSGGGGGEGGQAAVQLLSGKGETFSDALDEIQFQSNQDLYLGGSRLILISEKLAKYGLHDILDGLRRRPEIRRRQWPIVVKGKAQNALQANPKLEQIPMEYILNMLETGIRDGRFVREGLNDLYVNLANPARQPALNLIEVQKEQITWIGTAIFNKERMVGSLNRKESGPLLRIRKGRSGETMDVSCGKAPGKVTFRPKELEKKIRIREAEGRIKIRVDIDVRGSIVEKTCDLDLSDEKALNQVKRTIKKMSDQRADLLVEKAQKELKTDIFNFGDKIRAYHPDLWGRIDWKKEFPRADIDVHFNAIIRRTGILAQ